MKQAEFEQFVEAEGKDILRFCRILTASQRQALEEILSQVKIIDLSADYRIKDVATYEKWYGITHKSPQFIE